MADTFSATLSPDGKRLIVSVELISDPEVRENEKGARTATVATTHGNKTANIGFKANGREYRMYVGLNAFIRLDDPRRVVDGRKSIGSLSSLAPKPSA